jgi:hypothetical protein
LDALSDKALGRGVQSHLKAQRLGRTLTGMVIGRGANSTTRKNNVSALKGLSQGVGDATRIIPNILGIRQTQTPFGQELDEFGHVFVGSLTRENFISHDDKAKVGFVGCDHG